LASGSSTDSTIVPLVSSSLTTVRGAGNAAAGGKAAVGAGTEEAAAAAADAVLAVGQTAGMDAMVAFASKLRAAADCSTDESGVVDGTAASGTARALFCRSCFR
jgi:hypothetical protein